MVENSWDLIIVGGGLSGSLAALRIAEKHPHWRIQLLEKGSSLGGDHTWSFHSTDLGEAGLTWIAPLISRSWPRHEVRFPAFSRIMETAYHSIRSTDLHARVISLLGDRVKFDVSVATLSASEVVLDDGSRFAARVVLDARGFAGLPIEDRGYQKFIGLELEVAEPHGVRFPVLMDTCCEQKDGFRFIYLLPWSERTLLVEDTRYSDTSDLELEQIERGILDYANSQGWQITRVLRREQGALPIPFHSTRSNTDHPLEVGSAAISIGVRAGLFHPTTGYSLSEAVALAVALASISEPSYDGYRSVVEQARRHSRREARFFLLLNRMLFRAAKPTERRAVFERFYRLRPTRISRFYAGRLHWSDSWAILLGERPPVPVLKAIACLFTSRGEVA